jgi:orotidine-5'-phosphate decarboxylase
MEEARQRLIVALDVPSAAAAIDLVNELEPSCRVPLFWSRWSSVVTPSFWT